MILFSNKNIFSVIKQPPCLMKINVDVLCLNPNVAIIIKIITIRMYYVSPKYINTKRKNLPDHGNILHYQG